MTMTTGIPQLDDALMRGVPDGYTILVKGTAGSGKELFAKQFAVAGSGKENVVYFPTEESDEDLLATLRRFNWPRDIKTVNISTQYYERVLMRELKANIIKQEGLTAKEIRRFRGSSDRDKIDFLREMVYEISRLKPPFRAVVDSLDFFLFNYTEAEVIAAVRTIKAHTQYNKGLTLLTMTSDAYDRKLTANLEMVADIIIEMEITSVASSFENRLIVKKVRNYPEKSTVLIYTIDEKHGILPEMVKRIA